MSYSTFDEDIQLFPFLSFDNILVSLVYAANNDLLSQSSFTCALISSDSLWYPSSMLWSLYGSLLQSPTVSRIVYIWQDDIATPMKPADEGVEYVLWKIIPYDREYYHHFDFCSLEPRDRFSVDNVSRYSHVFYSRLLHDVALVPLAIPSSLLQDKNLFSWLISYIESLRNDPTTVCVLIDPDYSLDEGSPRVWSMKDGRRTIGDLFSQSYKKVHTIRDSVSWKTKRKKQDKISTVKNQWFLCF
jgi:hypothetical protein